MEVRKHYPISGYRSGIACLVLPSLKVHRLGGADTEHHPQSFRIRYPLSQRWIQAGATLLNKAKVKSRRESDHFEAVGDRAVAQVDGTVRVKDDSTARRVSIASGNCRVLPHIQTHYRLWKERVRIEIGVVRIAAVPAPETGVYA